MHQVDTSTAVETRPAPAAAGAAGWFSAGNPQTGQSATVPGPDWFNALQAEFLALLATAGLQQDKAVDNHMLQVLQRRFDWRRMELAAVTYVGSAQFKVAGDKTATYQQHRSIALVQASDASGYVASSVYNSGADETTVTVTGCVVDSGLTEVWYGPGQDIMAYNPNTVPVGAEMDWYRETPAEGWLEEDGTAYNMTTYAALDAHLEGTAGLGPGTAITADQATDTFTAAAHGRSNGNILRLTNSGGALPAGLSGTGTRYYVVNATTNTFQLANSPGGVPLAISDNGTGTHYFHWQFKVPNPRGRVIRVWDHGAGVDPDAASRTDRGDGTTGDHPGTKQEDLNKLHRHSVAVWGVNTSTGSQVHRGDGSHIANRDTSDQGGAEARMKNEYRMKIIKY